MSAVCSSSAAAVSQLVHPFRLLHDDSPRAVYKSSWAQPVLKGLHFGQRKLLLSEVEYLSVHLMQDQIELQRSQDKQNPDCEKGQNRNNDRHKPLLYVYAGSANGSHLPFLFELFDPESNNKIVPENGGDNQSGGTQSVERQPHAPCRFILVDPAPFCSALYSLARTTGAKIIRGTNAFDRVPSFPETICPDMEKNCCAGSRVTTGDEVQSNDSTYAPILEIINDFCSEELCARIDREYGDTYRIHLISDVRLGDPKQMSAVEANDAVRRDNDLQLSWLAAMPRAETALFKYHPPYPSVEQTEEKQTAITPHNNHSLGHGRNSKRERSCENTALNGTIMAGDITTRTAATSDHSISNTHEGSNIANEGDMYCYVDGAALFGIWSPKSSTEIRLLVTQNNTNLCGNDDGRAPGSAKSGDLLLQHERFKTKVWDIRRFEEQLYYYNTHQRYQADCLAERAVWELYLRATTRLPLHELVPTNRSEADDEKHTRKITSMIANLSATASARLSTPWFTPLGRIAEEDEVHNHQNHEKRTIHPNNFVPSCNDNESYARLGALLKDANKLHRLADLAPFVSMDIVLGGTRNDAHALTGPESDEAHDAQDSANTNQRYHRPHKPTHLLPAPEQEFWSYCTPNRLSIFFCWRPWHARLIPPKNKKSQQRKEQ